MTMRWLAILLLSLMLGVNAQAEPVLLDRIVAVVDNDVILQSDIEKKMQIELMSRGVNIRSVSETQLQDMYTQLLENEIQDKLLIAKAREDSIEVDTEMVEEFAREEIRGYKEKYGDTEFKKELERQGVTERQLRDDFRQKYRNEFLRRRMYESLSQSVTVSSRDVAAFRERYMAGESELVSLSHILIEPEPSAERQAEARQKAASFLTRIENGEDFAELARNHSEDPGSAVEGGDLGFFSQGTMVPEFENAAFALKPGEVSDIVQTNYGFHIIRLEEASGDQVRARHILILLRPDESDREAAHQKTLALYQRIQAGENFADLAREHSDYAPTAQRGGQMGVYTKTDLPPAFADAVRVLKPGGVTLPIFIDQEDVSGWSIAKVNDDATALEEIVKQQRLQDMFRETLAKTREKLYVDVRLEPYAS